MVSPVILQIGCFERLATHISMPAPPPLLLLQGARLVDGVVGGGDVDVREEEGRVGEFGVLLYQARACRFWRKVDFLMSCLMKECSVVNVPLFLLLMKPCELTSKQFTVQPYRQFKYVQLLLVARVQKNLKCLPSKFSKN